ncbi:glycosyltransferase family 4 protein [Caballeronia catudaia]|uniref:glycosyltransferase family 4 protein n=1 Tax=Caballeronia catudaia TaxID=1777136 RepID=UPI000B35C2C9|nr:glycosyltransferase family 4 protein [Caballeronia catudaia]
MRVAIVHEWLVTRGGSEKVLEEMLEIWPNADLFSVIDCYSDADRKHIGGRRAKTTFIQQLPCASRLYQKYLPLMPFAVEQLDLSSYDLVISSSHAVSKGVITGPNQLHICYIHSPIRYAWDMQHQYLKEAGLDKGLSGWAARLILHKIRQWDARSSLGVDCFVANSQYIARRVNKVYRREAKVIYPPVSIDAFERGDTKSDFYLTASRLVPYKKIPAIVEAFAKMPSRRLVVIGDGPEFAKAKAHATSNVTLMGYQPFSVLQDHMRRAKAFIFNAEEDFGIVPVEAQACGTPVIAFGSGGAKETIISDASRGTTGLFYAAQTPDAIMDAVARFESLATPIDPRACRQNAERFSAERFRQSFRSYCEKRYAEFVESCGTIPQADHIPYSSQKAK